MMKTTKKVAPDGGWGWMACFGVSLVNLATRSIEPSFGLLFGDLLAQLHVGTTGAAVIMSAYDVMMNFSGLFVGPLLNEFSYRKVAIGGSICCALGLALTSPAANMAHILATYSVINGIGVGLATSAAFVALNHYFKDKRGQAVGLSMAGTAMGMLILPQLVRILLEIYEFRGAVLILSGFALHAAVGSMLLQPVKRHLIEVPIDVELSPFTTKVEIIEEVAKEDDADDNLPEMKNLLFVNNKKMRKNFSDVAISTMNKRPSIGLSVGGGGVGGNFGGLNNKNPTLVRIMSNAGIISNQDLTTSVKKRRASVISHLSQLDFTGSNVQVHMNIGDDEAEEEDNAIRRVNTVLAMSTIHRDSLSKYGTSFNSDLFKRQPDMGIVLDTPKPGFWRRFVNLMDVSLLSDKHFLLLLLGLSLFYVAEMNFKMITPFFFASLGYTKSEVAFCLSIAAITDILARVVLPPICDRLKIRKRLIFFVSIVFVAITRSILAEQTEWTNIMVWLSISGFFRGSALANFTLTVSEYCSLEKLPAAFGWHMIGRAIFVVAFGPLIGAIRDWTDSYPICLHSQSIFIALCCIVWIVEYIYGQCHNAKTQIPESIPNS